MRLGFFWRVDEDLGAPQPQLLEQAWLVRTLGSCALRSLMACAFRLGADIRQRLGAVM